MNDLPPRSRYVQNHNQTEKYRVRQESITATNLDTRDWLTTTGRAKYAVFYAVLDKEKDVVVKVGPDVVKKEYAIGKQLENLGLPTFIQYYCLFDCLDDKDALFDKKKLPDFFCKQESSHRIHALVMPTIKGETIDKMKWNRKTFPIFKNVLKHIVLSSFVAMENYGFIHGDLHTGNIIIEKTNTKTVDYGTYGNLETMGYMPIIMDYDMSKINVSDIKLKSLMYKDLRRYIFNACSDITATMIDMGITNILGQYMNDYQPPTIAICKNICETIDKMNIRL